MKRMIAIWMSIALGASAQAAEPEDSGTVAGEFSPVEECFVEMPADMSFDCGYLTVPEFHEQPDKRTFSLAVVRLRSTAEDPKEPIFFGNGGPGGSGFTLLEVSVLSDRDGYFTKLMENHDLVFFSQRGTAYATPHLMCSAVNALSNNYLAGAYQAWSELETAKIEALKGCYDDLSATGVDFSAFNSLENAADLNTLRAALGYDKIIYYGESYGTMLGQHLMREYPETLSAVVLDGALSLAYPSWETALDLRYETALAHVITMCARDKVCSAAYPQLENDIGKLYRQLEQRPFEIPVGEQSIFVDAQQFSVAIYNSLYDVSKARFIPHVVSSMLENNITDAVPGMMVGPIPAQGETGIALPTHYAFVCAEDPTSSLEEASSLETLRFEMVPDYIEADAGEYIALCEYLDLPRMSDETDLPVSIDVPVLILNGGFDPVTPAITAAPIAEALPTAYMVDFPFGDHVQGSTDQCSHAIMLQFFSNPTTRPDTSCTTDRGNFEWFVD
ncbi:alpha/beta hydrolase [Qipengyuania sp. 1NDW9]|uniref:alpha/beta hydrolase n=1 Tax=Qipengyuania xiapuensis TaxID=2867236 RepID=UPI001C87D680|nr:alpha/beta fold hydrolase [Qipengyuania xiapuensis]MBX7492662.1 alpha/beta hydrolase [Qipengyuania xiapuensis]